MSMDEILMEGIEFILTAENGNGNGNGNENVNKLRIA